MRFGRGKQSHPCNKCCRNILNNSEPCRAALIELDQETVCAPVVHHHLNNMFSLGIFQRRLRLFPLISLCIFRRCFAPNSVDGIIVWRYSGNPLSISAANIILIQNRFFLCRSRRNAQLLLPVTVTVSIQPSALHVHCIAQNVFFWK